jgi:hypothetical protein
MQVSALVSRSSEWRLGSALIFFSPEFILVLLTQAVSGIRSSLQKLLNFTNGTASASENYHAAALSCLAAAFSTKLPSPALAQALMRDTRPVSSGGSARVPTLVHELLQWASAGSPVVRVEALAALRGAFKTYPQIVAVCGSLASAFLNALSLPSFPSAVQVR